MSDTRDDVEYNQAVQYAAHLNMSLLRQRTARVLHSRLQMQKRIAEDKKRLPLKPFNSDVPERHPEPAFDIVSCSAKCGGHVSVRVERKDNEMDTDTEPLCQVCDTCLCLCVYVCVGTYNYDPNSLFVLLIRAS